MNGDLARGRRRTDRATLWILALGVFLWLVPAIAGFLRLSAASVWDDSYIWFRYADRMLLDGAIAIGPGTEPSFGTTSLLYLIPVLAMRLLSPDEPALALGLTSWLCGIAFLAALWRLLASSIDLRSQAGAVAFVVVGLSFAFGSHTISTHFASGMDTTFVMLFGTVLLHLGLSWERAPTAKRAVRFWIAASLSFLVRPDMMLYALCIPAAVGIGSRVGGTADHRRFRQSVRVLLGIGGTTLALLLVSWAYFDSPLPLPFYAKTQQIYGSYIQEYYAGEPRKQLLGYLSSTAPLWLAVVAGLSLDPRRWWSERTLVERGAIPATAFFLAYYYVAVLQVMGSSARFFYPTLPALALIGAGSALRLVKKAFAANRLSTRIIVGLVVTVCVVSIGLTTRSIATTTEEALRGKSFFSFDVWEDYRHNYRQLWPGLDQVSLLPDDLVLATSELGHPLAMNPGKRVIDLAGLTETEIAHHGFSTDRFLELYSPDFLYLPHWHYREMISELLQSAEFRRRYAIMHASRIGAKIHVAVRKDSPYVEPLRKIIEGLLVPEDVPEAPPGDSDSEAIPLDSGGIEDRSGGASSAR